MHIHRLTAFQVPIALKKPVRHASHVRTANDTLIVRCVMNDGRTGWGEGLPRTYVTGDSMASAWRHLESSDFQTLREPFSSAMEAADRIDQWSLATVPADPGVMARECFGNAVRCAVELSILDAACRCESISLSHLIRQMPSVAEFAVSQENVFYSGAVTSDVPRKQWLSALKMRLFAFRQIKVKVGTTGIDDHACLRRVRRIVGNNVDLRLDANEAWRCDEVVDKIETLLPFQPTCLEQPVPHATVSGLKDVRQQLQIPVMLDESLCCEEDGWRAIEGSWCDLFNIRISKCGGLVRSMKLVALARRHGLKYQLGCQVGETGILSAVGRHVACSIPDLRYLEGSFDRFLVHDRLTEQDLTFRYGGRGQCLEGVGLGVDVDECRVRELAVRTLELIEPST